MKAAWYREAFARTIREALRSRTEFQSLKALHAEALRRWAARWEAASSKFGTNLVPFAEVRASTSQRWTLYEVIRLDGQGDISIGRAGTGYRIAWIGAAGEGEHLTEAELNAAVTEQAEWEAAHVV